MWLSAVFGEKVILEGL